jgi:hypothetical protein
VHCAGRGEGRRLQLHSRTENNDPTRPTTVEFRREEGGETVQVALAQGQRVTAGDRVLLAADRPVRGCSVVFQGEEAHVTAPEPCVLDLLPPRPMRQVFVNGRPVQAQTVEGRLHVEVAGM